MFLSDATTTINRVIIEYFASNVNTGLRSCKNFESEGAIVCIMSKKKKLSPSYLFATLKTSEGSELFQMTSLS